MIVAALYRKGDRVVIRGLRFRVHRYDADRDVLWLYRWTDVRARPVAVARILGQR